MSNSARAVGHRDSSSSSGPDLAALFNAFLTSLNGPAEIAPNGEQSPLARLAAQLSESLRKGLDERAIAPGVSPEARAKADQHARTGLGYIHQAKLADAAIELRQAVALCPSKAEWHGNLGVVLARLNKVADAEACFRTAKRPNCSMEID